MKLSLTVEADAINILAHNMGRIAVDIDGIELAELIDIVCDNGYSLRVADAPLLTPRGYWLLKIRFRPSPALTAFSAVPHISRRKTMLCCLLFHTSMKTLVSLNGFCTPARVICSTWARGRFRYYASNVSVCRKPVVAWWWRLCVVTPSVLFILDTCGEVLPGFATFDW